MSKRKAEVVELDNNVSKVQRKNENSSVEILRSRLEKKAISQEREILTLEQKLEDAKQLLREYKQMIS